MEKQVEQIIKVLATDESQQKLTQSHSLKITIPLMGNYDSQTFFQSCDVIVKEGESLEEASEKAYQWCKTQNSKRAKEAIDIARLGKEAENRMS